MEGLDVQQIGRTAAGAADTAYGFVFWIIIAIAFGLIAWYIVFQLSFKHKFRVKEVVNGRKIITDDKARIFKTKDGIEFWQLRKTGDKLEAPPPDAIETTSNGKKSVEAYKIGGGHYIYCKDTGNVKDTPAELEKIKDKEERELKIAEWVKANNVIRAYQPYNVNQRMVLINEHKKALSKKSKPWQDYILPVAGIASLTILVISLMIFWGDLASPLLQMHDKEASRLKAQDEMQLQMLEVLKDIKHDVQTIQSDTSTTTRPQGEPPN